MKPVRRTVAENLFKSAGIDVLGQKCIAASQTHISPKPEKREAAKTPKNEPTRRLSIDLPMSLHRRFKTACTKSDKKMIVEVTKFIERRTAELEKE